MRPTVAIGVGGAGCRMLAALDEVAARENERDRVELVAIDTDEQNLYDATPEDVHPHHLDRVSEPQWRTDRESFHYLGPDFELPVAGGAARQRALGRYAVENAQNLPELYRYLETVLSDVLADQQAHLAGDDGGPLAVWVLAALGGGTGSGAAPLVAALVERILKDTDATFTIGGVGSLPRLDHVHLERATAPAGAPEHYANAYAALRELRGLLALDTAGRYPLTLDIGSDAIADGDIRLEDPPFDRYWLVGFDERREEPSYREHMNAVVAEAIRYVTTVGDDGNGVAPPGGTGPSLTSVAGGTVRVPLEDLERYVDLGERLDRIADDLRTLEADIETHTTALEYLDELTRLDPTVDDLANVDVVDSTLLDRCREAAAAVDPHEGEADAESEVATGAPDLDATIERVAADIQPPGDLPARDIAARLYCPILRHRLRDARRNHPFVAAVNEAARTYQTELADSAFQEPPAPGDRLAPLERWARLEEGLTERLEALDAQLEETPWFRPLERSRLESLRADIDETLDRLANLADRYRRLEARIEAVDTREDAAEAALRDAHRTHREALTDARHHREDLEAERTAVQRERSELVEWRRDLRTEGGEVVLPVAGLEGLSREAFAEADSIAALIEADVVDRTAVAEGLGRLIDDRWLDDPVQDRTDVASSNTRSTFAATLAPANRDGPTGDLLELERPNGKDIPDAIATRFHRRGDVIESADGMALRLLAFHTPVSLDATSEFGTLHEYYTAPERDVSELFGDALTDADISTRIAYPELIDDAA